MRATDTTKIAASSTVPMPTMPSSLGAVSPRLWDDKAMGRDDPTVKASTPAEKRNMLKSVRSRAEEQFAASQKKDQQALKEKEKARQESADHIAGLRALRLAKEAAEAKAAAVIAAEKAEKVSAKKKKVVKLPQAHRGEY